MPALFFAHALLPEGWAESVRITLDGGRIGAVVPDAAPQPGDGRHGAALPGLPNLHSHAFQRAMAGLCEVRGPAADSFWTWREVMYRFLGAMEPEDVEAVSAQAFVEMLEAGFTRVGEFHYLHHGVDGQPYADPAEMLHRVAAASALAGIRLTLLPVFYAQGGFGAAPPAPGQRRFLHGLDGFARLLEAGRRSVAGLDGGVLGAAPHSLRAATPAQLAAVAAMQDGPVHIHAAEQMREVEECLAWSGARPVAWLLDHAAVDARWCLVHATHMVPEETVRLARSGAVAGLCPVTEANLGDGIFPAERFAAAGGRFGVGTDSNVAISATGELRTLEYSQRLALRARNVLAGAEGRSTGRALFEAAWRGGGQALGASTAGLRAGERADLVALDLAHPTLAGKCCDSLLDGWVFGTGVPAVESVWVGGRQVVAEGRHRAREAVAARFARSLRRLAG